MRIKHEGAIRTIWKMAPKTFLFSRSNCWSILTFLISEQAPMGLSHAHVMVSVLKLSAHTLLGKVRLKRLLLLELSIMSMWMKIFNLLSEFASVAIFTKCKQIWLYLDAHHVTLLCGRPKVSWLLVLPSMKHSGTVLHKPWGISFRLMWWMSWWLLLSYHGTDDCKSDIAASTGVPPVSGDNLMSHIVGCVRMCY